VNEKSVVVITQDVFLSRIAEMVLGERYRLAIFKTAQSAIDYIYNAIPNLVIVNVEVEDSSAVRVLNNLKQDPIFSQLPVLAVLSDTIAGVEWETLLVEDYLRKRDLEGDLRMKVDLCVVRSERVVEINPLTRLPGNISINRQIQNRLNRGQEFALAYADLDHFKPFNDTYGFSRGDDVLKMTARLVLNMVKNRQPRDSFVGHIGGDDFVFIVDVEHAEQTATEIIEAFDLIIPTFYDVEDRSKGMIDAADRQGSPRTFPIMTISVGITHTRASNCSHYGEMTEVAAEMKRLAKRHKESCYKIDQRRGRRKVTVKLTSSPASL
jgi:diguanylate cyclase (GGDEF)-like protein